MTAGLRIAGAGVLGAALLFAGTVSASASPTRDDGQAYCEYTLSKPFLVEVSGTTMVSATLSSLPCTGVMLPNEQTVCVELQGGGGAPKCNFAPGYAVAQVYFAPYRPGSTYVSTGKGCAATAPSLVSTCDSRGPISAVL